jgi:hypothetical protein
MFFSISGWNSVSYNISDDGRGNTQPGAADSLAKKYFPLKTGNSWTYKMINLIGDTQFVKISVLSDTVIQNVKFYKLSDELPFFTGKLITLDTLNGNLYGYKENGSCGSYKNSYLIDSLASKLGNRVRSCTGLWFGKCMDTGKVSIGGFFKSSKFLLSPAFPGAGVFNRFAEDVGITYALKIEGIRTVAAFLTGCVINNNVLGDTTTVRHISGIVRYKDNNLPVINGYVKALQLNRVNGNIIVCDSVPVNSEGRYNFHVLPVGDYYIVAYPNSEEECDYVVTYYPSTINWQNAVKVNTGGNPENLELSVFRKVNTSGMYSVSGNILQTKTGGLNGISAANVYIRQGEIFKSFSISKPEGEYKLEHLNPGVYEIIVNRLGYVNASINISVNNANLQNINFFLEPTFIKDITTINNMPKKFKLEQNYPNPFNPGTKIKFDLPKSSFVSFKIYNLTGKEVMTVMNGEKQAGSYEVYINGLNLSSGLYFYSMTADGFTETKTMLLIK